MSTVEQLESRREGVLSAMRAIRSMHRGTINEQYLKVRHRGKAEAVLRGPYYVLSRREGGRTVSRRLTSEAALAQARSEVAAYERFVELCKEYERWTEQLGEVEGGTGAERGKKRRS